MPPPYLTGETLCLRSLVRDDRESSLAWYDSPFPINATRADNVLQETQRNPWNAARFQLAIVRRADERVVGSVTLDDADRRTGFLSVHVSPALKDGEAVRAEVLRIAIPWLRDEMELMTVTVTIAADAPATIATAESLGMVQTARVREALAMPAGRVDLLYYQALNPRWQVRDDDA